mmetsp:Transcript_85346/g.260972  ORF Transcript_85346/g.260972 Transcript_85346/m.260972 type:complete len:473 (+) Transcript_85346:487-1905(+)
MLVLSVRQGLRGQRGGRGDGPGLRQLAGQHRPRPGLRVEQLDGAEVLLPAEDVVAAADHRDVPVGHGHRTGPGARRGQRRDGRPPVGLRAVHLAITKRLHVGDGGLRVPHERAAASDVDLAAEGCGAVAPPRARHLRGATNFPFPGPRVVQLAAGQQTFDHAPAVVAAHDEHPAVGEHRRGRADAGPGQRGALHPLPVPVVEHLHAVQCRGLLVPPAEHVQHVRQRLVEAKEGRDEVRDQGRDLARRERLAPLGIALAVEAPPPVIQDELRQRLARVRVGPHERLPQDRRRRRAAPRRAAPDDRLLLRILLLLLLLGASPPEGRHRIRPRRAAPAPSPEPPAARGADGAARVAAGGAQGLPGRRTSEGLRRAGGRGLRGGHGPGRRPRLDLRRALGRLCGDLDHIGVQRHGPLPPLAAPRRNLLRRLLRRRLPVTGRCASTRLHTTPEAGRQAACHGVALLSAPGETAGAPA